MSVRARSIIASLNEKGTWDVEELEPGTTEVIEIMFDVKAADAQDAITRYLAWEEN